MRRDYRVLNAAHHRSRTTYDWDHPSGFRRDGGLSCLRRTPLRRVRGRLRESDRLKKNVLTRLRARPRYTEQDHNDCEAARYYAPPVAETLALERG